MTRKHFELLAAALRRARPEDILFLAVWRATVDEVADTLRSTNPLFDRRRFIAATEK